MSTAKKEEEEEATNATTTNEDAEAQAARDAAEARRQRILEGASARMGLVEGTYSKNTTTADTAEEGEGGEAVKPKTTTASSKMAAMRRRRFKKGGAATKAKTETKEGEGVTVTAESKEKDDDDEKKKEKAKDSDNEEPEETKKSDTGAVEETEEEKEEAETTATTATTTTTTTTQKKYMGVAKMRRRKLKEQQQQKKEQEQASNKDTTSTVTATKPKSASKAGKKGVPARLLLLPIAMHVVVVVLMFLAGLDIGLQQGNIDYGSPNDDALPQLLQVHSELAPRQLGGLQKILSYGSSVVVQVDESGGTSDDTPAIDQQSEWVKDRDDAAGTSMDDEFADVVGTNKESNNNNNNNIDPLFRVDLDKFTQGTGFVPAMARGAVAVHRFNLRLLYYYPKSFFQALVDMIWSLFYMGSSSSSGGGGPPMLCLIAIVLRQILGKMILGAKLPPKVSDETQHKDIMSMVKQFLSNYVLKAFPTAVGFYDAFTHLRSDMYVLLCGFFVGLAWSHNHRAGSPWGSADDLGGVQKPVSEGISDEL